MSTTFGSRHTAKEIVVRKAEKILAVTFEDGKTFELPAELLRVESPSAEVQGHSPDEKTLVSGRGNVGIIKIDPVGNYAIGIAFDDLHDSGIYTWDYLYHLGEHQAQIWADYEAALSAAGLSRDPASLTKEPAKGGGCGGGKAVSH
jgi:DUF971 family protein